MNHKTELRVPADTWEKLRKLSYDTHKSINSIVCAAIEKYLEGSK